MIVVNNQYLHLFIKARKQLLYPIHKGLYLSFNSESLEYEGIEMFYLPWDKYLPEREADKMINQLIAKSILEVRN